MAPAASDTPVLILTGPPGVGKTTAAESLAGRSRRAVHLESDAFFRFVRSGYVEPWRPESHEQNSLVIGIVGAAAAAYAAAGYFTIVDGIVIPSWFLAPLRGVLEEEGLAVAYAVLRAPSSVCAARVRGREGEIPIDSEVIGKLWSDFAELGEFERNVVEVGEKSPEQIADTLRDLLLAGELTL